MDKKYTVDDILEEIKRKKQNNASSSLQTSNYNRQEKGATSDIFEQNTTKPIQNIPIQNTPTPNKSLEIKEQKVAKEEFVPRKTTENSLFGGRLNLESMGSKSSDNKTNQVIKNIVASSAVTENPQTNSSLQTKIRTSTQQDVAEEISPPKIEEKSKKTPRLQKTGVLEGFGDNAYKPYEAKPKQSKNSAQEKPTYTNPANRASQFKLNIVGSFFDEEVKSETKLDIPITNLDTEKAALGFTRTIPALKSKQADTKQTTEEQEIENSRIKDDYERPEEAEDIAHELKRTLTMTTIRLIALAALFGVAIYSTYALNNPVGLPRFMFPEESPFNYLSVNIGFAVFAILLCYDSIGTGLVALFTLKPDADTPIALASLATVAQGVALLTSPEEIYSQGVNLYFSVVIFGLLINTLGKYYMAKRIRQNFEVVKFDGEKYAAGLITDAKIASELTKGQNLSRTAVAYSCKADFLTGFMYYSYSEDYSENISKITSPLFLVFNTIIAIGSYILFGSLHVTLSIFAALMCICAPITATLIGSMPLWRLAKRLSKKGAAVAGYQSLDDFDEITTIAVDANELFSGGFVELHGIKPFAEDRIDEAIIDAASVIVQANGLLTDTFMEMIGRREGLLKEVDSLMYEDSMGLSAWVDGKRVLIGNRRLLENHGIEVPATDYERKFAQKGRDVVYISNSGELTAMFVLSYHGTDAMSDNLEMLADKGIGISVYTTDPNITSIKIEEIFGFPSEMITIMSSKMHTAYNQVACDRAKAPAKVALPVDFSIMVMSICAMLSAKGAVVFGTMIQILGMIMGYALTVFFAFTGEIAMVNYFYMIAFQLAWALLTMAASNLRRI